MKTQNTKTNSPNPVKNLAPRDERDVKAGSINFTKIEYKDIPYDSAHKP